MNPGGLWEWSKKSVKLTGSYVPTAILNHIPSFNQRISTKFACRFLPRIHESLDRVPDDI